MTSDDDNWRGAAPIDAFGSAAYFFSPAVQLSTTVIGDVTARDGFRSERLLVDLKVSGLAAFLSAYPLGDPGLEHVFDY